ncbi:MAG: hypothetical protein EXS05_08185 [Planctomycetaceae bacterium]|nr:hypothetical protein [Planctomycetaceae bacterium]
MRLWHVAILCAGAIQLVAVPDEAGAALRFAAQLQSGKRIEGNELRGWHETKAEPRLDAQELFNPADRAVWIEDRAARSIDPPAAFIEFTNGDRLPGRVTAFRTGRESAFRHLPPHFLIAAAIDVDSPDNLRSAGVPIRASWLRRVVWQKSEDERYQPGTLWYRDGRQLAYRALRWAAGSVRLLLEQETREIPFAEIAEVHLPAADPWEAWLEQLALIAPAGTGRLIQIETTDGVRLTCSMERFLAQSRDPSKPELWQHGFQPAWSVEPVWLWHRTIRMRRFFDPQQPPLTLFEPSQVVQRANFIVGGSWQRNRSVQRLPLRCSGQSFAWGLGVHAYCELTFELPSIVRGFRSQYGLDQAVGRGGCVRAAVFGGPPTGAALHQSAIVVGSRQLFDTGVLALPDAGGGRRRLTLVVDPVLAERPAGADPFEIRDMFDWLQPTLELDLAALQSAIHERSARMAPVWHDWALVPQEPGNVLLSNLLDPFRPQALRFVTEVAPRAGWLGFSRQLEIQPEHHFLLLAASRFEKETAPSRIQVRVEGRATAEFELPVRNSLFEPDPLLVPVDGRSGRNVTFEVFQIGDTPQARVEWRAIDLVAANPVLYALFDEANAAAFVDQLQPGPAAASLATEGSFTGPTNLQFGIGTRETTTLPTTLPGGKLRIRNVPQLGEYRFIRWAWKKRGGRQIALHLAHDGEWGVTGGNNARAGFRYRAGRDAQKDLSPGIDLRDSAPEQWDVVTRDLAGEFGEFDLTGLRFECGDGEAAHFDQIYLARQQHEFDRLPAPGKPSAPDPVESLPPDLKPLVERIVIEPTRFGELLAKVAPAFSTNASEQGVWQYREHFGRQNVVRTHPVRQDLACILRAPLYFPAGQKRELRIAASHHKDADWQLIVKIGPDKLYDQPISAATTKDGWADVNIDLSQYAGRNVVVEVHNHPSGWSNEFAFWGKVEVITP